MLPANKPVEIIPPVETMGWSEAAEVSTTTAGLEMLVSRGEAADRGVAGFRPRLGVDCSECGEPGKDTP